MAEPTEVEPGLWHIPSSSDPEIFYEVDTNDPENVTCTCPGFVHRQTCKHQQQGLEAAYMKEQPR